MSTRSLKYTVRVNTRDDADLVEHLRGKNVSKTFKDALKAQIHQKDSKIDEKIREQVIMCLYDLLGEASALEPTIPFSRNSEGPRTQENRGSDNISSDVSLGVSPKDKPTRRPHTCPEDQDQPTLFPDPEPTRSI